MVAQPDGAEIVRRHVLAAGGEIVPADGSSRTFTYELHFNLPNADAMRVEQPKGTMVIHRMAPNRLRTRTTIEGLGETHGGYDGTVGWAQEGNAVRVREGSSLAEIRREAIFDREIHLDLVYPSAELLGTVDRDGTECWHVALNAEDGSLAHGFFNAETGLLHELARQLDSPVGAMGVIQRFTEWTDFDGRRFPTRIETRLGGTMQTMILIGIDDAPLAEALFAVPDVGE